jgi:D-3-phosphoglycerate dehydrogenase / 2-oxoglutarate reductase
MTPTASHPVHNFYVSDPIHPAALAQLHDVGTVYRNFGANPVAFTDVADSIDAVLLRAETFGADKISAAPRLKIIARHGTGTDNVDIAAATAASVWVTVTPGANSGAVAEHVFALLLTLARRTGHASTGTAAGQWSSLKPTLTGSELGGRTLGLVGFGRIARHVGRIARGFGMTVIAADPHVDADSVRQAGAAAVSLPELFAQADVISLHAPLTPQTRHLINSAVLAGMRPGAVLINTSRGELVDEQALVAALQRGHLGGAALDVLEGESIDMREPLAHSYLRDHLGRPDLIVTPHVAGQTDEALLAAGTAAVACIRQALNGHTPDNAVNHLPDRQALAG